MKIILAGQQKQTQLYINWLIYVNLLTALHRLIYLRLVYEKVLLPSISLLCSINATMLLYSGTFNIKVIVQYTYTYWI